MVELAESYLGPFLEKSLAWHEVLFWYQVNFCSV